METPSSPKVPEIDVRIVDKAVHDVALLAAGAARDISSGLEKVTPAEAASAVVDAYIAAARRLTGYATTS